MKPDLDRRLQALSAAVAQARGRIDDSLLDETDALAVRAAERLRLSSTHTVVAIAGATGSGKSTTFNALVGAEVAAASAQRPTTSTASAVVWSDDDVTDVLDWLGVPPGNRRTRAELGLRSERHRLPDGLVLLDLPDHDSIVEAHHEEARRVVALADVLIWVVDPQKYADAAIHREFLQPLAGHRDVTMIVLNQIDTVPESGRAGMLRDVRKLLAADGMRDARVLGISARRGTGIDDLRTALHRRVEEKRNAALRIAADLDAAVERLRAAVGDGPTEIPQEWIADLERRVLDAAAVPRMLARASRSAGDLARATVWRPWRAGHVSSPLVVGAVDRPAVDTAVRSLTDRISGRLAEGWSGPLRQRVTGQLGLLDDRLDAELAAHRVKLARGGVPIGFRLAQATSLLLVLGAALMVCVGAPALVAACSAAVGLAGIGVLAGIGRRTTARRTEQGARVAELELRRVVGRVLTQHVVGPASTELASYRSFATQVERAAGHRASGAPAAGAGRREHYAVAP